jgi:prefoldin subunit 5
MAAVAKKSVVGVQGEKPTTTLEQQMNNVEHEVGALKAELAHVRASVERIESCVAALDGLLRGSSAGSPGVLTTLDRLERNDYATMQLRVTTLEKTDHDRNEKRIAQLEKEHQALKDKQTEQGWKWKLVTLGLGGVAGVGGALLTAWLTKMISP